MEIDRPEISKEFLDKVKVLARAKMMLPSDKLKTLVDINNIICECEFLPDGSLDYRISDKSTTQLRFKIEDGSPTIIEYKSGEWLQQFDIAYGFANVLMIEIDHDLIKTRMNLLEKINSTQDIIEQIECALKLVKSDLFYANAWELLSMYCITSGQYKNAARAAITAVNLEPDNAQFRLELSKIYYTALLNSKWTVSLGCTLDYARQVVEKHCQEVLRLSKNAELNRVAEQIMSDLHSDIDGQAEFGTACELCELDTSDALDDITDSVQNTKTPKPPSDKPLSKEIAIKGWEIWWEIFVRQYSQRCVKRWAAKCVQMKDYNDMKRVWLKAFEPLWLAGCELEKSIRLKEIREKVIQNYQKSGKLHGDDRKSIEAGLEEFTKSSGEIASQVITSFRALQSQSFEATLRELPKFDQASLLGKLKRLIYDYRV